jgi:hypothetical protein
MPLSKRRYREITESKWVELLSLNARKIFGLDYRVIQKDLSGMCNNLSTFGTNRGE